MYMALRRMVQIFKPLPQIADRLQDALRMFEKDEAAVRERHRLIAIDQNRPEFLFQTFDLRRYGRLRQIQQLARFPEAHRLGYGDQRLQLVNVHDSPSFPVIVIR
ncbi:MAG: hypothetical protein K0Q94_4260 [Paenibacillus sp.]|nr:hypothetical protein [Paenibacillus sp.]